MVEKEIKNLAPLFHNTDFFFMTSFLNRQEAESETLHFWFLRFPHVFISFSQAAELDYLIDDLVEAGLQRLQLDQELPVCQPTAYSI